MTIKTPNRTVKKKRKTKQLAQACSEKKGGILKAPSSGQCGWGRSCGVGHFKGHGEFISAILPIFGPAPTALKGLWQKFEMMEKAAWNVHWLQLGCRCEAIWSRAGAGSTGIEAFKLSCRADTP